jgi:hypothetical protein
VLASESFAIPKGDANPWRKVWERLIKQGEINYVIK